MRSGCVERESANACAVPWNRPGHSGQADRELGSVDGLDGLPERGARAQVERQRDGGNCPWWVMGKGGFEVIELRVTLGEERCAGAPT